MKEWEHSGALMPCLHSGLEFGIPFKYVQCQVKSIFHSKTLGRDCPVDKPLPCPYVVVLASTGELYVCPGLSVVTKQPVGPSTGAPAHPGLCTLEHCQAHLLMALNSLQFLPWAVLALI